MVEELDMTSAAVGVLRFNHGLHEASPMKQTKRCFLEALQRLV